MPAKEIDWSSSQQWLVRRYVDSRRHPKNFAQAVQKVHMDYQKNIRIVDVSSLIHLTR